MRSAAVPSFIWAVMTVAFDATPPHLPHQPPLVVISAAVTASAPQARRMDYSFLTAVAARNWARGGFRPVVLLATDLSASHPRLRTIVQELKGDDIVGRTGAGKGEGEGEGKARAELSPMVYILPVPPPGSAAVAVSQVARLFAALLPGVTSGAGLAGGRGSETFMRVTDVDVLLLDAAVFAAPGHAAAAAVDARRHVHVYGASRVHAHGQYPMHSIGMSVGLWRTLFAPSLGLSANATVAPAALVRRLLRLLRSRFGYNGQHVQHGAARLWSMDQQLAYAVINGHTRDSRSAGAASRLPMQVEVQVKHTAPGRRFHLPSVEHTPLFGAGSCYADAHLAGFDLARDAGVLALLAKTRCVVDSAWLAQWRVRYEKSWRANAAIGDGGNAGAQGVHGTSAPSPSAPRLFFFGISHESTAALAHKAQSTWARHCNGGRGLVWYSNREDPVLNATVISVGAGDAYANITQRVLAVWQHVWRHYPDYDWYVRLWPDNYAFPDRFTALAAQLDPAVPLFVGRLGWTPPSLLTLARTLGASSPASSSRSSRAYFVGGGASGLVSRAALRAWFNLALSGACHPARMGHQIVDDAALVPPSARHMEDVLLSHCMQRAGVTLLCARGFAAQNGLHEEVMLTPDEVVAGRAPVRDAPAVQPPGMACLNDPNVLGVLALHYVTEAQMEMLERAAARVHGARADAQAQTRQMCGGEARIHPCAAKEHSVSQAARAQSLVRHGVAAAAAAAAAAEQKYTHHWTPVGGRGGDLGDERAVRRSVQAVAQVVVAKTRLHLLSASVLCALGLTWVWIRRERKLRPRFLRRGQ